MKKCSKCGQEKELSLFYKQRSKPDGFHNWCKTCKNESDSQYRSLNRDLIRKKQRAKKRLWRTQNPELAKDLKLKEVHNISLAEYQRVLNEQNGECAICGDQNGRIDERTGRPMMLSVDHDHTCCPGKNSCGDCFRGLLCNRCNMGMGHFNDDPELMFRAVSYLIRLF